MQQLVMNEFSIQFGNLGFNFNKYVYDPQTLSREVPLGTQYLHVSFTGYDDRLRVSPDLGLSCHAIEDILAELNDKPYEENEPRVGTVGGDLRLLLPTKGHDWVITPETNLREVVSEIKVAFETFGLPHLNKFQSIGDVLRALSNVKQTVEFEPLRSPIDLGRAQRAIIAAYLLNDKELFEQVVEREKQFLRTPSWVGFEPSAIVDKLRERFN